MIIDFHAHTFPDALAERTIAKLAAMSQTKPNTDGTNAGLLKSMENAGVDISVVLPVVTNPKHFQTVNDTAARINEEYEGRLISFGGIHPDVEDYKSALLAVKNLGLKGVKIHPDYQGVFIDDIRFMHILECATNLDLCVVTHAGVDIGMPDPVHCPPDKAREVIRQVNPKNFILAHTGGWKQWDEVLEYLAGEDVYFDTAFTSDFLESEKFVQIVRSHGAEKILFATDSPWENPIRTQEYINASSLNEEEKSLIYSGNACRLLGISK